MMKFYVFNELVNFCQSKNKLYHHEANKGFGLIK